MAAWILGGVIYFCIKGMVVSHLRPYVLMPNLMLILSATVWPISLIVDCWNLVSS